MANRRELEIRRQLQSGNVSAQQELKLRRELSQMETTAPAADVSRETIPSEPAYMQGLRTRFQEDMERFRNPDFEGMAQRLDDLVRGAADVMTFGTADEIAAAAQAATGVGTLGLPQGQDYETALAQERARDEASDPAARLTGNVLGGLALGGAVGAPRSAMQAMGQGAGFGGAYSFGSGEGGVLERAIEGGKGAGLGAVTAGPIYGVANVVAPRVREALQTLRKEGVRPTIGQMAGPMASRIEERLGSVPFAGDIIRGARSRALDDFNIGAINHALRPAGIALEEGAEAGRKAISQADDLIAKSYGDVLDQIPEIMPDDGFARAVDDITTRALGVYDEAGNQIVAGRLGRQGQKAFINAIDDMRSFPAMQKPSFTGKEAKRVVANLREDADRLAARPDEDVSQAGLLVREVRDALSNLMKRNTTPENAAQLTGLDRAYAGFNRVRDASEAGREGIFTPFQLSQQIKKAERASGRRGFARGEGLGQAFAEAGDEVISSRVPDSGTPERTMLALLGAGVVEPSAAIAAGTAALPYTRPVQNALAWLAARPAPSQGAQMIAQGLRRSALPAAAGTVVATE